MLIVLVSVAPYLAGYLLAPAGMHFTGAPVYNEDRAQHETWARQMAAHGRFQNVLTPEPTPRGWFVSPLDLLFGLMARVGIPIPVTTRLLDLACAPFLAFALMTLARRAGVPRPGLAAVVSLLAGSLAPLLRVATLVGIPVDLRTARLVGADATPVFALPGPYLLLAVLFLLALPTGESGDEARGFRLAGGPLFLLALVFPFFVPVLWITAALGALFRARLRGSSRTTKGLGWLALCSVPMLYWAILPRLDSEYARFAASNRLPLFSPVVTVASLGLGSFAFLGALRLLRGNAHSQILAAFAVALLIALYIPAHPWRSHLFYLSPILVIAAIGAWWPSLLRLRPALRWVLTAGLLGAAFLGTPNYYRRHATVLQFWPPTYLTTGDVAGIEWIARQPGTDVVLARSDLSPWIAARGNHCVLVGYWLWTHDYGRRRTEVDDVFRTGAEPRALLRSESVRWVFIDGDRGVPEWTRGIEPVARFDHTAIFSADSFFERAGAPAARRD